MSSSLLDFIYETAVKKNKELIEVQNELKALNEQLEQKVKERTAALEAEITERKRAEEKLSETRQMLVNIALGITDGILVITKDFKIVWANEGSLTMTGRKMEELVGNYCYKATHHSESPC